MHPIISSCLLRDCPVSRENEDAHRLLRTRWRVCEEVLRPIAMRLVVALMVVALAPAARAEELCLVGGQVIDPGTRTVAAADVVIDGTTIARVGPGAGRGCRGRRLDVAGRFVMPGLIDLHVHGWGNPSPTEEAD